MSKINGPIRLLVTEATTSPFARHVRDWADTSLMELAFPPDSAPESLVKLAPECEALLCYQALVSAALINAAPHLRFIQKHGLNCRNIALDAARERGIPVATTLGGGYAREFAERIYQQILGFELARTLENPVRNADLSDIVHRRRELDCILLCPGKAGAFGDQGGVLGHPDQVHSGHLVPLLRRNRLCFNIQERRIFSFGK